MKQFLFDLTEMDALATRLRGQDGEQLVASAKQQIARATVGIAAVAGALVAQAALMAFRAEQDSEPQTERIQIEA